jgi:hypothetical protein
MAITSYRDIVHLEITRELGYDTPENCHILIEEYNIIGKMLYRLIENWRSDPSPSQRPRQ